MKKGCYLDTMFVWFTPKLLNLSYDVMYGSVYLYLFIYLSIFNNDSNHNQAHI